MKPRLFFADLDGLRGIAAMAVVLYHGVFWLPAPETAAYLRLQHLLSFGHQGGMMGVTFFFVLSGFLITRLLIEERKRTGRIRIGSFYMRRLLRIWPLYYAALIIGILICTSYGSETRPLSLLLYATFLANFDHIWHGFIECGILGVQWSVSVEEQYYLVWPILFLFIDRFRHPTAILLLLATLSLVFTVTAGNFEIAYHHPFACARFLLTGGILAYLSEGWGHRISGLLNAIHRHAHLMIYASRIGLMLLSGSLPLGWLRSFLADHLPLLFFAYALLHQTHSEPGPLHARHYRWLGAIGRISYGLYLLHMFPILLLSRNPVPGGFIINLILAIGLAIALSATAFRFLELPFLRLKLKWSSI